MKTETERLNDRIDHLYKIIDNLIDVDKLYRILAVQRAIEDDMRSESLVFSARTLKAATADTLSPIYSTMGARLVSRRLLSPTTMLLSKIWQAIIS